MATIAIVIGLWIGAIIGGIIGYFISQTIMYIIDYLDWKRFYRVTNKPYWMPIEQWLRWMNQEKPKYYDTQWLP